MSNPSHQPLAGAFSQLKQTKTSFANITANTDLSKFNQSTRLEIYKQFLDAIEKPTSKEKMEHRAVAKSMYQMITDLLTRIDNLEEEKKSLSAYPPISNQLYQTSKFNSVADCVKNKKPENVVLIRSKNNDSTSQIKKSINASLNIHKKDFIIRSIKEKRDTVVIDLADQSQQEKIIECINRLDNVVASKPKQFIPSIQIDHIQRDCDADFDYIDYVKSEISSNHQIKKEDVIVKKLINNIRFKSVRAIVNLDQANTKKVLETGFVKIGYMACPTSRTCNVIQCRRCFKYGHFEKDKSGNVTCKSDEICPICAEKHNITNCPIRGDKSKLSKCSNCSGNHTAFSSICPKNLEAKAKVLSKSSC